MPGFIFRTRMPKGHIFKVCLCSTAGVIPRTTIRVTKDEIMLRETDEKSRLLIDCSFDRKTQRDFYLKNNKPIAFSVNLKHVEKMIRSVKKKDCMILYIDEEKKDKLVIQVMTNGTDGRPPGRKETHSFAIKYEPIDHSVSLPNVAILDGKEIQVYDNPLVVSSLEFQKIKRMISVGKKIEVRIQDDQFANFYADLDMMASNIEFGIEKECKCKKGKCNCNEYRADFYSDMFNVLVKLPGLSSQVQIYAPRETGFPLRIGMKAGEFGEINVYAKDVKQILLEEKQIYSNE